MESNPHHYITHNRSFGYSDQVIWKQTTLDVIDMELDHVEYQPYVSCFCTFQFVVSAPFKFLYKLILSSKNNILVVYPNKRKHFLWHFIPQ